LKLSKIAQEIDACLDGDGNAIISGVASNQPSKKKILFVEKINFVNKDFKKYGAILTSHQLKDNFKGLNILISNKPRLSFAKLTSLFSKATSVPISKNNPFGFGSIFLADNVLIGSNFKHGCNVIIEDNVSIGDNVTFGHNVVICKDTKINNNVVIDSGTVIGSEGFGNVFDKKNGWNHISHLGKVIINDNVVIGVNCSIDRGTIDDTVIEKGVILDNQIHIAHNVTLGEYTAIAANTGIAGSSFIGKRNMIGGMVGIVDHITTADDVIISATSTVNKNLQNSGVYTGIMPISKHASWKRIALWITKLDKIVKIINFKKVDHDKNEY